ncbi:hypothetical protein Ddc_24618 [Ditylenchus destructor]|nr:hypothetical protein Ddc_24618 [Ditylenchus destructor]
MRSKVLFPQPLAPTSPSTSPAASSKPTSDSTGVFPFAPANRFALPARPAASCRPSKTVAPPQRAALDRGHRPVAELAQHRQQHDRRQHQIGPPGLPTIGQQIAQPAARRDQLRRDHEHPRQAEPVAQPRQHRRQGRGQQHTSRQRHPPQPTQPGDLDQLAIHVPEARGHTHVDREEGPDGDQRDLGCLVDAQPQQQQRHPGQRWNRAQRLEARRQQRSGEAGQSDQRAQQHRQPGAEREPARHAQAARQNVLGQLPLTEHLQQRLEDRALHAADVIEEAVTPRSALAALAIDALPAALAALAGCSGITGPNEATARAIRSGSALMAFASDLHQPGREARVDQLRDRAVQIDARPHQLLRAQDGRRRLQGLDMLLRRQRMREVAAQLHLKQRHRQADLGLLRQDLGRVRRIRDRPRARPLIGRDRAPHHLRVFAQELLAHIEEAVARPRHRRALLQRRAAVGVLQGDVLDVGPLQAHRVQRAQQEEIRIGALGRRHLAALEVRQRSDARIAAHHQRGPFRPGEDVGRAYGVAVGAGQQRGQAGGGADVDAAGVEVLQRAVAAGAQHPAHADVVLGQVLLQPAEAAQHQAGRRVVGVVQPQLFRRAGALRAGGSGGKAGGQAQSEGERLAAGR